MHNILHIMTPSMFFWLLTVECKFFKNAFKIKFIIEYYTYLITTLSNIFKYYAE